MCRTVSLDCLRGRASVQAVEWHPGSVEETHLVLLTTDNILRVHNVGEPGCPVQQTIQADPDTGAVAASLGETAVDFAFGPEVELEDGSLSWPLFVLWGNGDVFCASSCLGDSGETVTLEGPLGVQPPVEDNYSEEACSVAVVGTGRGRLSWWWPQWAELCTTRWCWGTPLAQSVYTCTRRWSWS